ncbi:MAG: hypothetical protein RB191_19900 [Terriglobia bacterium]|nr:hypothetical protein [Terriglobia bacterium]
MLFCVGVRKHDEYGRQDTKLLIEADDIDQAAERGLEFARSTVYFGAKAEYVEWFQVSGVETPYIMQTDAPKPTKKRRKRK